jgi:hypothetical protein
MTPTTVAAPEMVNKVHDIVTTDRLGTERYTASISLERIRFILTVILQ